MNKKGRLIIFLMALLLINISGVFSVFAKYPTIYVSAEDSAAFGFRISKLKLDPRLIYQVHLVKVGSIKESIHSPADIAMKVLSLFGHTYLKIVLCPSLDAAKDNYNPQRCNSYHPENLLSLNMAAYDLNARIDPMAALLGGHPLKGSFDYFNNITDYYNMRENRNVMSYPISILDRSSPASSPLYFKRFARLLAEITHGEGAGEKLGSYKLLSNNCSTAILNLMKLVVPENEQLQKMHIRTPKGLVKGLKKLGFIDKMSDEEIIAIYPKQKLFWPAYEVRKKEILRSIGDKDKSKEFYANVNSYEDNEHKRLIGLFRSRLAKIYATPKLRLQHPEISALKDQYDQLLLESKKMTEAKELKKCLQQMKGIMVKILDQFMLDFPEFAKELKEHKIRLNILLETQMNTPIRQPSAEDEDAIII